MESQFYMQDKRQYIGNDVLWWAEGGKGYTTDVSRAGVYTKEQAVKMNQHRETDIPWPKSYVDSHTRPAVDMQTVDLQVSLADTGITLHQPAKPEKEKYKCEHCGKFVSESEFYSRIYNGMPCENCSE